MQRSLQHVFMPLPVLENLQFASWKGFDSSKSVSRKHLSHDQDWNRLKVTVVHLPKTKTAPQGKDVFWAKQHSITDPNNALENHLLINNPPQECHLFAYLYHRGSKVEHRALTKTKFLERITKSAWAAELEPLQGHSIRIGSTSSGGSLLTWWRFKDNGLAIPSIISMQTCHHFDSLHPSHPHKQSLYMLYNATCTLEIYYSVYV
jgi:hypothetical protein